MEADVDESSRVFFNRCIFGCTLLLTLIRELFVVFQVASVERTKTEKKTSAHR